MYGRNDLPGTLDAIDLALFAPAKRRGGENWQGINPMWRDAAFAIFGFLPGVTMALWILILVAPR
jgi:hypothetical protein